MSSTNSEILLVRHAETAWSVAGRHTGRTDVSLTERGRDQARLMREVLAERRFTHVLTSPRRRAVETCELAGYLDRAELCDELVEWDYGDYEGRTTDDIRTEVPNWTVWTHPSPNGESAEQVGRRADQVIERIRATDDSDVVLFSHGHMLRILAARWCGLSATDGRLFRLDPATLSTLGYERETAVIRSWNVPVVKEAV
jgi:probable phosphoglycerate mutase